MDCKNGKCNKGCCPRCKLQSFNWLEDVPGGMNDFDIVEVHFKNTRKGFYRNSQHLPLEVGDVVAVEANPGHDIGTVAMVGKLVQLQMKRANLRPGVEILRVFRKAKPNDLEVYEAAKAKEIDTMIRSRQIAADLKLNMKIGDVEYQGDGNKAIFYYIADDRVDFRQLIKVLAEKFKVRIEMKQIGARQEAGRIGGIGPCGRPLCCSSWMTNFVSVATGAARYQDISLNPQKLAGQCAKLKCCLNFEVDTYVEASKQLPQRDLPLETKDNTYYHFKTDIFKRLITYSTDKSMPANLVTIPAERVYEVIALNKNGVKPDKLELDSKERQLEQKEFGDIIGQDSVTRFDKKKKKPRGGNGGGGRNNRQRGNGEPRNNGVGDNAEPRKDGEQPRKGGGGQRPPRRPRNGNNANNANNGGNNENNNNNPNSRGNRPPRGGNGPRRQPRRNEGGGNEQQTKDNKQ